MDENLDDKNCLQIVYGLTVIRVYYLKKGYYCCKVNMNDIIPKFYKKAYRIHNYLTDELKNSVNIDVRLFYNSITTPIKKKCDINDMTGYYNNTDMIYKCLLLLI